MPHARVQLRQNGRVVPFSIRRIFLIFVALGLALSGGVSTADAGVSHEKVFVCKYVGQPRVDERLQTGGNPIDVSISSIKPFAGLGSYFADEHGQSFVLAWADSGVQESQITDCPAPRGPDPVVTSEDTTSCTTYSIRTITTPFVLKDDEWVPGERVLGAWVDSTPTSQQLEAAGLDCRSEQPAAKVVVTPEHTTSCTEYSVRDVTVTTPYVWNAETQAWELGTAGEPVVGEWVTTAPTHQQIKDAGLVCKPEQPRRPDPILTSSVTFDTTCTAFTTTTTSTITEYVLRDGVWVLGDPVETTGKPVVSTPTAEQIAGLPGLHCTVDVPPVDVPPVDVRPVTVVVPEVVVPEVAVLGVSVTANPKVTRPAKASVSVLGVSATANPLPVAASAGAADTSGQVAAGGLTGLAAFLAFGAAFMLRRRRGVV